MTNSRIFTMILSTIICLMMVFTSHATAQECGEYEVTAVIVGPQCGGFGLTAVLPQALSDEGVVVGYIACLGAGDKAFYWSPEDGLQFIPMPDGTNKSQALAISGSKIVGLHTISGDQFGHIAFLYDYQTNEFTSMEPLPGGDWSEAHDINSKGEIVGFWGNTIQGPSPPLDLLEFLANWGPCPCGPSSTPLSLEQEMADACLTMDDWNEYQDVMTDPLSSQADKDRYDCWMRHYIEDCRKCTCSGQSGCPEPDPFG